tara:strand:+ start:8641 stop:8799 length:159 start_codon:yes stop_codon:yes gene_type:complete
VLKRVTLPVLGPSDVAERPKEISNPMELHEALKNLKKMNPDRLCGRTPLYDA